MLQFCFIIKALNQGVKLFKQGVKNIIRKAGFELKLNRISPTEYTDKGIVFVHIAKCGGISIDTALRSVFASPGQPRINRNAAINTSLKNFTQDCESPENSARFGDLHSHTIQMLVNYHLELNWSYISGHTAVTSELLAKYANKNNFVTVLREPIARFISHYIYTKLTNELPIMLPNKFNTDNLIQEAKGILNSRRGWHMINTPTMCLTGQFPKDVEHAKQVQSTVANNLKHFSAVGFLDELPQFVEQIKQVTNKDIVIPRKNVTNKIVSEEKAKVEETLRNFFDDKATKLQLNTLAKYEIENYAKAKEQYSKL